MKCDVQAAVGVIWWARFRVIHCTAIWAHALEF